MNYTVQKPASKAEPQPGGSPTTDKKFEKLSGKRRDGPFKSEALLYKL